MHSFSPSKNDYLPIHANKRMFAINVGSPICGFRMKAFVILALHYKKGLQIGFVTLFHSSVLLCISPSINTC